MPMKLTANAIARLRAPDPSGRQTVYFDADLRGFGLLVSGVTPSKTFIVQRKLPDRRTRRITIGPANVVALEEARTRALAILKDCAEGKDPKEEKRRRAHRDQSLRKATAEFLNSPDRSRSARKWPRLFEVHLGDWLDRPLREVDGNMVEERHRRIQAAVKARQATRPDSFLSAPGAGTANLVMRAFRTIWNHVAERAGLPESPTRRLRRRWFAEPRRERMVPSDKLPEFYRAASTLENPRDRDLVLLLLWTGLRAGEASCLRWSDLDFAQRVIRLSATATKNKRKLDLPMVAQVRDLLVARRAVGIEGPHVFPAQSRSNQSAHATVTEHAFAAIDRATGIRVSAHDLRRGYLTIAESYDISPLALKALANHSLGGDVTSGYIQMTVERLRGPAQRVADRIAELCEVPAVPEGVARIPPVIGAATPG
jgi:integrase